MVPPQRCDSTWIAHNLESASRHQVAAPSQSSATTILVLDYPIFCDRSDGSCLDSATESVRHVEPEREAPLQAPETFSCSLL